MVRRGRLTRLTDKYKKLLDEIHKAPPTVSKDFYDNYIAKRQIFKEARFELIVHLDDPTRKVVAQCLAEFSALSGSVDELKAPPWNRDFDLLLEDFGAICFTCTSFFAKLAKLPKKLGIDSKVLSSPENRLQETEEAETDVDDSAKDPRVWSHVMVALERARRHRKAVTRFKRLDWMPCDVEAARVFLEADQRSDDPIAAIQRRKSTPATSVMSSSSHARKRKGDSGEQHVGGNHTIDVYSKRSQRPTLKKIKTESNAMSDSRTIGYSGSDVSWVRKPDAEETSTLRDTDVHTDADHGSPIGLHEQLGNSNLGSSSCGSHSITETRCGSRISIGNHSKVYEPASDSVVLPSAHSPDSFDSFSAINHVTVREGYPNSGTPRLFASEASCLYRLEPGHMITNFDISDTLECFISARYVVIDVQAPQNGHWSEWAIDHCTKVASIYSKVLVPLHLHWALHFVLLVFDMKSKTVSILDSLTGREGMQEEESIAKVIGSTMELDEGCTQSWVVSRPPVPQQKNNVDCGIHVLIMALYIMAERPLPDFVDCRVWRSLFSLLFKLRSKASIAVPQTDSSVSTKISAFSIALTTPGTGTSRNSTVKDVSSFSMLLSDLKISRQLHESMSEAHSLLTTLVGDSAAHQAQFNRHQRELEDELAEERDLATRLTKRVENMSGHSAAKLKEHRLSDVDQSEIYCTLLVRNASQMRRRIQRLLEFSSLRGELQLNFHDDLEILRQEIKTLETAVKSDLKQQILEAAEFEAQEQKLRSLRQEKLENIKQAQNLLHTTHAK